MTTFRAADLRHFVNSRAAGRIGLVVAALMSTLYAAWFASRPLYNWDMIPYVAVALRDPGNPPTPSDRRPMKSWSAPLPGRRTNFCLEVPSSRRIHTISGADYRYMVAHRFKNIRRPTTVLHRKTGLPGLDEPVCPGWVNPITATMIISGTAYAAICLLLYVWISRWLNPAISLVITALLSLNPVLIPLAQLAPDSLSVLMLLLGTFLAIELGFAATGIAVFVLSILVRPENIIYVFIFTAYLLITARLTLIRSLIALGVAFGVYFVQTRLSHNYGWVVLFNFTFFDWTVLENPSNMSTNMSDYLGVYAKEIFRMFFTRGVVFPLFLLVGSVPFCCDMIRRSHGEIPMCSSCFSWPFIWPHEQLRCPVNLIGRSYSHLC